MVTYLPNFLTFTTSFLATIASWDCICVISSYINMQSSNERRIFLASKIEIQCSDECNYISKHECFASQAHTIGISSNFKVEWMRFWSNCMRSFLIVRTLIRRLILLCCLLLSSSKFSLIMVAMIGLVCLHNYKIHLHKFYHVFLFCWSTHFKVQSNPLW